MSVALADDIPETSERLGTLGKEFSAEVYVQPWETSFTQTIVLLSARKLDDGETTAPQHCQTPADPSLQ